MTMDNADATFDTSLGSKDFGSAGVSESPFGQDAGAGGTGGGTGGSTVRQQAGNLRNQAADKLRSFADEGKSQVASTLDGLVTAAREIAGKLESGPYGPIGGYATTAADTLQGWTDGIKNRSVDDLLEDGREFVRKTPAVAVGAAVAAGFVLSRVLKAGGGRYSA